jgi:diguanylate cyclase (GGDEF)-like protein
MQETLMNDIDDKNLATAHLVLEQRHEISNVFLQNLANTMGVDYIWFYSPTGEVMYDASGEFIGWTPTEGDWIDTFIESENTLFITDIRLGDDMNTYIKSVFLKDSDGYFVEVAYSMNTIMDVLSSFELQEMVDQLVLENESIYYVLFIDQNYVAIADSDHQDIGIDYSGDEQYELAMSGTTNGVNWFYEDIQQEVYEVASPVYFNGDIVGIIGVGYALDSLNAVALTNLINTLFTSIIIIISYILFQLLFIYKPFDRLNQEMHHPVHIQDQVPYRGKIFTGLFQTMNHYIREINEKNKLLEEESKKNLWMAHHDYLTNLYNRRGFINQLKEFDQEQHIAIFYFDIDNFKHFNDLKGHYFGDQILIQFAERLKTLTHPNLVISRFGGDEFVIGYQIQHLDQVNKLADEIQMCIHDDIVIDDFNCFLLSSIGIALYPQDGQTISEVVDHAETAMRKAKITPHTTMIYFNDKIKEELTFTTDIVEKLKKCITEDGFEMHYQPQVNVITQEIVGFEALLRFKDSNMSPGIFVPIAEKHGLMHLIGRIVIQKVMNQIAQWKKSGHYHCPVYINLSSTQLHDISMPTLIKDLLKTYQIDPQLFGVEITEDVFLDKEGLVLDIFNQLKQMGILTAIDDFGSGQAGVNYLTNFEVNLVKIGKNVADKYLNVEKKQIYQNAVNLCKSLNFSILAEGIETLDQINLLKEMNVPNVQGFYYYKAMTVKDIEKYILK